ncbi:MAG: hypothetical protein ABFR62_12500 [Bacteroidota bacterium]
MINQLNNYTVFSMSETEGKQLIMMMSLSMMMWMQSVYMKV